MPMITIDGKEYDLDTMSDAARQQLQGVQFVDTELVQLSAKIAVYKTARLAYATALNQALKAPSSPLAQQLAGDTIKLG